LASALAHVADRLARTLTDVPRGLSGTLPDILQRALGTLTDVLGGIARLTYGLARSPADLGNRPAQSFHQLGIAIEARHQAIDDGRDVVEARLQHHLRLDSLDVELDPAEVYVHAHVQLDEIEHVRPEGDMSVEVVEFEVDQIDGELRHVE
jgi:hypothetical protein